MDNFSLMKFYGDGGFFMHPILIMLIISTASCIKQYLNLTYNYTVNKKFFDKIKILIKDGRINEAYQCSLTTYHPLSKILAAILYNSNKGRDVIESAAKIEIQKVLPYIREINYISLCAKISFIFGILGVIQNYSQGMAVAMNSLSFSLIVAIPCLFFYTYLNNKVENILKKYNEIISEVTHLVLFKPNMEVVNEDLSLNEYRRYGT